ncbi:CoA-transferase, partial [Clostridium perfringens]
MGKVADKDEIDLDITNAGGQYVTINDNGAFFDTSMSLGFIQGGNVDLTIPGALEVNQNGNFAHWIVLRKM